MRLSIPIALLASLLFVSACARKRHGRDDARRRGRSRPGPRRGRAARPTKGGALLVRGTRDGGGGPGSRLQRAKPGGEPRPREKVTVGPKEKAGKLPGDSAPKD